MNSASSQAQAGTVSDAFLAAMRNTANCVAIVATDGVAGRFGITVSSMVSVSAEPPMLLVCINRNSPAHEAVIENRCYSINVAGIQQQLMADRFAGRGARPYAFDTRAWHLETQPLLADSAAQFICELVDRADAGTHAILVGRVHYASAGTYAPLCYSQQAYARPAPLEQVSTNSVLEEVPARTRLISTGYGEGRVS